MNYTMYIIALERLKVLVIIFYEILGYATASKRPMNGSR